jgi:HSP90 family molecular chaperone
VRSAVLSTPPIGTTDAAGEGGAGSDLQATDVEVLYLYSPLDDFVMNNLREFNGRKLTTAETAELDPDTLQGLSKGTTSTASPSSSSASSTAGEKGKEDGKSGPTLPSKLSEEQVSELSAWWVGAMPTRVAKVRGTTRLRNSPAVVTDHESASLRRMMRMVEATAGKDAEGLKLESHMLPKQTLEVNASHPVIVQLHCIRETSPGLSKAVAEQILDNALIAAGLVDDARTMLPRLNALLEQVLGVGGQVGAYASAGGTQGLSAKRWTPPKEKDERDALKFGEELYAEVDREIRKMKETEASVKEAMAGAAAGGEKMQ